MSDIEPSEWPPIGSEPVTWDSRGTGLAGTRAERDRTYGVYQAAVPPFIAAQPYALPLGLAAAVDDATAELARYDAEMETIPIPFDAIVLRSESAASSQIEHLTASARSIALAELGDTSKRNASLIIGNVRAMRTAIALTTDLSAEAIAGLHRTLLSNSEPELAGRWRTEAVWIGTSSVSPIGADYVAPRHERIAALIADLLIYANRVDQPVLVQTAIAHAQFETIHPFHDGNGRTGRALIHAMLRRHGLVRHVTVPVSAGLLHDIEGYHRSLTAYRAGDPEPIIARTVDATFRAINNGRTLAAEVIAIRTRWRETLTARRHSAVWAVADLFLARPVLDAAEVAAAVGIAPTNAHRHLDRLTDAGVLTQFGLYRRGLGWRAEEVLGALDRFAVRAGRRTQV